LLNLGNRYSSLSIEDSGRGIISGLLRCSSPPEIVSITLNLNRWSVIVKSILARWQLRPVSQNNIGAIERLTDLIWTPTPGLTTAARAACVVERCIDLARFTEVPGETTRTYLSPPMHDVHRMLGQWMAALGMEVAVDAIGNLRGLLRGKNPVRLVIASHLDTVPNAGAFDGILGVVIALALIEARLEAAPSAIDIEVIGFAEEEGVRFAAPFLGSLAFTGEFPPELLDYAGSDGITIGQAIRDFGLDPTKLRDAAFHPETRGYLEFHIEQGPVLEKLGLPLAAVEGIAGQSRLNIHIIGQPNHAGTTPMDLRKDALAAAAHWISAVEHLGRSTAGLVATVGRLNVKPGAGNVVPGEVEASLDVRHLDDSVREGAVQSIIEAGNRIAAARGLSFDAQPLLDQPAVLCSPELTAGLRRSMRAAGYPDHVMSSGAGHDAMIVAARIPTTMLFLRSPGGISHHPSESVLTADVAAAIETGLCFLKDLEKDL
jgi:allantoate deiminase